MSYTRGYNPVWLFDDLVGNLLDDTYYMFVLQNTLPYLPQPIWSDMNGVTQLPYNIQFLANGTLPIDMYWDDTATYRLEIRQGPTQDAALIYLVENYQPTDEGTSSTPATFNNFTTNQITNEQFAVVSFSGALTSTATSIPVAPGWVIVNPNAATVTVSQVVFNQDSVATGDATNPSYGLSITSGGVSGAFLFLEQVFPNSGNLFAGAAVAMNFTASSTVPLQMQGEIQYSALAPAVSVIVTANVNSTLFQYHGAQSIPPSTSPASQAGATTTAIITWPVGSTVVITGIQVIGETVPEEVLYQPSSIAQQTAPLYLAYKPIPSYLVGWNFPLNPCQLLGPTVTTPLNTGTGGSVYIADQTIVFQSVNSSLTYAVTNPQGLTITTANTTQFAVIQYIPLPNSRILTNNQLCMEIAAFTSAAALVGNISLYYTTAAIPTITSPTNQSIVNTLTAGLPTTLNGTWTLIPNTNGQATFTAQTLTSNSSQRFDFNGWNISGASANYIAVVISFAAMPATNSLSIPFVTLQTGNIPTSPAPQTDDDVLRECQLFFETNYDRGLVPGATTGIFTTSYMNVIGAISKPTTFNVLFRTKKRILPLTTFYNPFTGATGSVRAYTSVPGGATVTGDVTIANWQNVGGSNQSSTSMYAITQNSLTTLVAGATDGFITYNWTADARIGVV